MAKIQKVVRGWITDPDLIAWSKMIKMLAEGKYNNRKLAAATGLTYLTICRYTRALRQVGAAHIHTWEPDRRGKLTIKVYKLGTDDDAEKPNKVELQRQRRKSERIRGAGRLPQTVFHERAPLPEFKFSQIGLNRGD